MQVAFNGPTTVDINAASVSSFSQAYTVNAGGSNLCAVARIEWATDTAQTVSAITYGGVTMTSVHAATLVASDGACQLFTLVAPATGSNTFAVTMTGTESALRGDIGSFSGVNQTTPVRPGSFQEATNTQPTGPFSTSITIPSNQNDLTVSACGGGSAAVASTNQTSENIENTGSKSFGTDHATAPGASITHTWTSGSFSSSSSMEVAGFSLQVAPSPTGSATSFLPGQMRGPRQYSFQARTQFASAPTIAPVEDEDGVYVYHTVTW